MKRAIVTIVAWIASCAGLHANEPNRQLLALSEQAKHEALSSHVRQSGENCDAVVGSMLRHGVASEPAFWNVGCHNQKTYWVIISPDPGHRPLVLDCESSKDFDRMLADMVRRAGQQPGSTLECWKKF